MINSFDNSTIVNLKVVSELKRGQRLNTKMHLFSIVDGGLASSSPFLRWWHGESRESTVNNLNDLFTKVTNPSKMASEDYAFVADQLVRSSVGIQNLIFTYESDKTVVAALSFIQERIGHFVRNYGSENQFAELMRSKPSDTNFCRRLQQLHSSDSSVTSESFTDPEAEAEAEAEADTQARKATSAASQPALRLSSSFPSSPHVTCKSHPVLGKYEDVNI